MIGTQCESIMGAIQAGFPRPAIPDTQLIVWHKHLSKLNYDVALEAVDDLVTTSVRLPAIAEFHQAYDRARAKRVSAGHHDYRPLTEGDVASNEVALGFITNLRDRFRDEGRPEMITEKMLNDAGVTGWRERLASAAMQDSDDNTNRKHWTEAWEQIKGEYRTARHGPEPEVF